MIEFEKVTRRYGTTVAVDALTLTIPPGELFTILGPNGAGKTTTMRMLAGLLRPDAGQIRICGQNGAHRARHANRLVGYVPEEPFLYEKLSGREMLEFVAEMHGLDRRTARERMEREIERFDLAGFVDALVEGYSHGMKQRVAFATALLHDPAVLIVDEPTVGLDPRSVRVVKDLLRAQAAAGKTVFMSTHTLAIAEEIADRIGILSAGRLKFLGTLATLQQELSSSQASLEPLFLQLTSDDPPPAPAEDQPP
jgi:ABC-2 type transport system ATP-binding protein